MVIGCNRVPEPPARMIPRMERKYAAPAVPPDRVERERYPRRARLTSS